MCLTSYFEKLNEICYSGNVVLAIEENKLWFMQTKPLPIVTYIYLIYMVSIKKVDYLYSTSLPETKSKLFKNFIHLFIHVEQYVCLLETSSWNHKKNHGLVGMQLNILVWNNDWLQLQFSQEVSRFLYQYTVALWHLLLSK